MQLFNKLCLQFEKSDWSMNPEFGLIDTLLENNAKLYQIVSADIIGKEKTSPFGRGDTPSVEQIIRAAIYKEMKGLDYRELEYAQTDSRICATFIKLDLRQPFSFQMFQKYISRISVVSLQKLLVEINKIAIAEGYEDLSKMTQDSTVVKSNIHYPTNNSLVWDCLKESHRLLEQLNNEIASLNFEDYRKGAKKVYFKINTIKSEDKREKLFTKQLQTFTKTISQVSNAIKKKSSNWRAMILQEALKELLPVLHKVYSMAHRREILKELVPTEDKLFSIYERHTDMIKKGGREILFGHKVNLASGNSNLILDCDIVRGNPKDTSLYAPTLDRIVNNYKTIPRDIVVDGGYMSQDNLTYSKEKGIVNIVFSKIVGSMKNVVSSSHMETRLKKWRSKIEAIISNLKRGFNIRTCTWKGWEHFQSKVLWSVLGYNFRVLTSLTLQRIAQLS